MMKRLIIGSLALAAVGTTPVVAQSAKWVQVGMLDCTIEGGVGLVLASRKNVACRYQPSNRALPQDAYVGTVTRYGVDVGALSFEEERGGLGRDVELVVLGERVQEFF